MSPEHPGVSECEKILKKEKNKTKQHNVGNISQRHVSQLEELPWLKLELFEK